MQEPEAEQSATDTKPDGRTNIYVCPFCAAHTVTVDLESGVTPYVISCEQCKAPATSTFYRLPTTETATLAWRKPTAEELAFVSPATREHARRGGLLLYRYDAATGATVLHEDVIADAKSRDNFTVPSMEEVERTLRGSSVGRTSKGFDRSRECERRRRQMERSH